MNLKYEIQKWILKDWRIFKNYKCK